MAGVAGVDVFISELRALLPTDTMGHSALAFILNNNGDAIFFENLDGEVKDYAERIKPMVDVDFLNLWSRPAGNGTELQVQSA